MIYHSTKTAKIFWVTLDVAMYGAAYGRPIHIYQKIWNTSAAQCQALHVGQRSRRLPCCLSKRCLLRHQGSLRLR